MSNHNSASSSPPLLGRRLEYVLQSRANSEQWSSSEVCGSLTHSLVQLQSARRGLPSLEWRVIECEYITRLVLENL